MHRLIMGHPDQWVDHINGNKLDNRRENLRLAYPKENAANSKLPKNNTSGYRGVRWTKNAWQAAIKKRTTGENTVYLGRFENKEDAARAYDKAALEYFGEFARLNFPKEEN